MFLRAYRHDDKRSLQQLFFETVHTVNARDYAPEQLNVWAPPEPDRETWARLDHQFCFVVEFQKVLVGFISMTGDGVIEFLFVHKNFQGKGIASALFKQVERLARKKGIFHLKAEVSITARGFFEKNGFAPVAESRKMLQGMEFLHYKMEKTLPHPAR
jgi:putative acetyltransferase